MTGMITKLERFPARNSPARSWIPGPGSTLLAPGLRPGSVYPWLQPYTWRQEPPGRHSQAGAWEREEGGFLALRIWPHPPRSRFPATPSSLPGSGLGVYTAWLQPYTWRQEPPGRHSQAGAWERGEGEFLAHRIRLHTPRSRFPATPSSLPGSGLGIYTPWLLPCMWRQEPQDRHPQAGAWEREDNARRLSIRAPASRWAPGPGLRHSPWRWNSASAPADPHNPASQDCNAHSLFYLTS